MKQRSFLSARLAASLTLALVLVMVAAWPTIAAPPAQQPPTPDLTFETDEIPEDLSSVERSQFILLRDAERATANLLAALETIPGVTDGVTIPGAEATPGALETPAAETTPGALGTPVRTTPAAFETPAVGTTPGVLETPAARTAPGQAGAAAAVTPAPTTAADPEVEIEATTLDIDDATNTLLGATHDILATVANGLDDLDRILQREAVAPPPGAAPGTPGVAPGVATTPGVLETPGAETTPGAVTTPGAPGITPATPIPGAPAPGAVALQATPCGDLGGVVRAAQGDVARLQGRVGFFGRLFGGPDPVEQRLAISDLRTHHQQMQQGLRCLATAPAVPVTGEEAVEPTPGAEGRAAPPGAVTLTDITDNPERFFGQTVTVDGEVNVVHSPNAFTIAEDATLDLGEILVLHDRPLTRELREEVERVRVTGTVREFTRTEIERDLGLELDDQLAEDFEGRPVIVARSVRALDAEAAPGVVQTPRAEATPGVVQTPGVIEPGAEVTLNELTDRPEDFFGQRVTVSGEVDDVFSERVFTLGDPETLLGEVLVVMPQGRQQTDLTSGATVQVTGEVREMDSALFDEFGIEEDLRDDFELFISGPAIVADTVNVTRRAEPGVATPRAEATPGVVETPRAEATPGVTEPGVAEPGVTEPGGEVSLTDITGNPEQFYGRRVTVTGNVNVILSPNAFTIAEVNLLDLGEITILSSTPRRALNEGEPLRVTGTVRQFVRAEIERDLDFDLDEDLAVQFEEKPVIVADSITPVVER